MTSQMLELGQVMGSAYTKDGDPKGKIRFRINGKTIVDGKICQINGTVTEVKGQR